MAVGKKGVVYTMSAIILLLLVVASFIVSTRTDETSIDAQQMRVMTMNTLVKNIERDVWRGLHIANLRSLISIEKRITEQGTFVSDSETAFIESLMNGTIEEIPAGLMENSTLPEWISRISYESSKIGVEANITIDSIDVFQDSPWTIKTSMNVTLDISDLKQTSRWSRKNYFESEINLTGYEDPLYAVNTLGRVYNTIRQSPYGGNWTDAARNAHLDGSYYVNNSLAPSFLMRLEGNMNSSEFGIESMINLEELTDQDISIRSKTAIDYLYFGNIPTTDAQKAGMPSWFWIDGDHESRYGW